MSTKVAPAVVVLGQNSVPVARQLMSVLKEATLYGLAGRTFEVDVSFTNFSATLRDLFGNGRPIIGICAAGILIRTLAPMLSDKRQEPPVLAIAEDGSAVVPLLGGLNGVNDLARRIAEALNVKPAITTTGNIRFGMVLENPPTGYRLANPEHAKTFTSDLLAGATVRLEGTAPWLSNSSLPMIANGELTIQITERLVTPTSNCLVYHPATVAIGIGETAGVEPDELVELVQQQLTEAVLATASVAGVFAIATQAANPGIHALAQAIGVPARFFTPTQLEAARKEHSNSTCYGTAEAAALTAAGASGRLIVPPQLLSIKPPTPISVAMAIAPQPIDLSTTGQPQGRLAIVGTGPGGAQWMSPEVKEILHSSTDLVGYSTYLNLVGSLGEGKRRHESDNREEEARARMALDLAATGRAVALVSSGDPGIYAMAAAVFELLDREAKLEWGSIDIQVAPGISAMQAAAAKVGAPLGHDFCAISLSDILKPWSIIEQRITSAAVADFVIAFYNPASPERTWQLAQAQSILLRYRSPKTPIVLARNLGRPGQTVEVLTLEQLVSEKVDMRTIAIVGSNKTRTIQRQEGGIWVYTPRRYMKDEV